MADDLNLPAGLSVNGGDVFGTYDHGGTWTPALTFGGNNTGLTYATQAGRYMKVGRLVYWSMLITLSAKGSSTGTAVISGLPVASANNTGGHGVGNVVASAMMWTGQLTIYVAPNSSNLLLWAVNPATGVAVNPTDTAFVDASTLIASGCYEAAS